MFVPFLYELLLKSLTQSFGFLQILWFYSLILNEFNAWFKREFCSTIRILYMYMNRHVLIRIEVESQSKR